MGKGGKRAENGIHKHEFSWEEIQKHDLKDDQWIVIEGKVYDVSTWMRKHPGGARVIGSYAGQDATDVWNAMHRDKALVHKYMKPLYKGDVVKEPQNEIEKDFRELRQHVEEMGWMETNPGFYIGHLASILAFEVAGYLILSRFGTSWLPYMAAVMCFVTSQAQAGWLQHDFGHLSVFKSSRLNHWGHFLTMGHIKGASKHWWNFRHFLHHAKPNIIKKDPDVKVANLFLLGEVMPRMFGLKKKGFMPHQFQHIYFVILTPLLLPTYFVYENLFFVFQRRDYWDLFFTITFFYRMFACLGPIFDSYWSVFFLFVFARAIESNWFVWCTQTSHIPREVDFDLTLSQTRPGPGFSKKLKAIESNWFVWCTQMSHIPREVDFDGAKDWVSLQLDSTCNVEPSFFNDWFSGHLNYQIEHQEVDFDGAKDWVSLQLDSTCNVEPSFFNDWFSGHLNYQIEHHLFPRMPRHNFSKVAPLVKSLCKKHGINYQCKTLIGAFGDILRSLRDSGEIWYNAYYEGLDH